ncbi:alcohol dehydrogenase catalytic domain-containing protein [Pseudarthrobacter sp. BIM B-2242]|uniref:alcohol dehydrogenase catalytic domain-containing protein n=1 Tax=Pseudarthrobacter sp. BIM B-2242 TaxID=2772401 RepID=UPI00168A6DA1|nr:alcohol dehydrogenase catalytic domain-containing protein [Pseudarthrobacter sp. BIM B-2242]QOD03597.1 alcohol dehydrogenase catalytic domain-containing protein [Pseudarthrobacter sp. BIM B-2242]
MLTARTIAKETISFEEVAEPSLEPGHALVRMHHVALCGTDLHIFEDDYPTDLPIIQGHESSGVVEAIGEDGGAFRAGDRVAISPMIYCGQCEPCQLGRQNVCRSIGCIGCYSDGAMVELLSVPVEKLCLVPEDLPLEIAAMGEPASIAMQAVNRGRPVAGETALVLGSGPIGLLATLYLTDLGVTVLCADTEADRLELATAFGAADTLLVDPRGAFPDAEQAARLDSLTDGNGPILVIEATGVPSSFENAVRLVAGAGRIVQVGISPRAASISMKDLPFKELDIMGSRNSLNLIPDGLALLARHPDQARALMTHRFDFSDLPRAYALMGNRTEKVGKIVIDMPAAQAAGSAASSQQAVSA